MKRKRVRRIVVDTGLGKGVAEYGNMGDIAMLQVAVDRLHKLFPTASIEVLTDSAENLTRFCPDAKPLSNAGRVIWFANGVMLGRFAKLVPEVVVEFLVVLKRTVRSRYPSIVETVLKWRLAHRNRSTEASALTAFTLALQSADLVLICGAGGFYDGCQEWNLDMLDLLEAAVERGIPAAMLGQGFGPLSDPMVLKRATKILPKVNYITLRGGRGSLAFLRSLGVANSRIETTGDEALELAYKSRSEQPGRGLGINMRFAGSAGTDKDDLERIRPVLQEFAKRHDIPLIPLPIAMQAYSRDDLTIKELMLGFDNQSDGGKTLDTPLKVIRQAALCRVVVTGAYHAAVFALAQGIPVVGIAKSNYFSSKLMGLEEQFGEGCQTILLNDPTVSQRLSSAIESAWQNADQLRGPLLRATLHQIESSRKSYRQIADIAGTIQGSKTGAGNWIPASIDQ